MKLTATVLPRISQPPGSTTLEHRGINRGRCRWRKSALLILAGGLVAGLAGCATTRQATKGVKESGFLGDYSQLHKGKKGEADLVYMDHSANWAKYTKIHLVPVQLWKADDPDSKLGKMDHATQQRLIDFLNTAVVNQLKQDYQIVNHDGPDVLVIRGAITEARPSKPVINLVSSVYAPLRILSLGKQSLAGTGIGVGSVTIEVEILDGETHQRLAAAVDRRAGTKALRSKVNGTWGDVEESFTWWAQKLRTRLAQERAASASKAKL